MAFHVSSLGKSMSFALGRGTTAKAQTDPQKDKENKEVCELFTLFLLNKKNVNNVCHA